MSSESLNIFLTSSCQPFTTLDSLPSLLTSQPTASIGVNSLPPKQDPSLAPVLALSTTVPASPSTTSRPTSGFPNHPTIASATSLSTPKPACGGLSALERESQLRHMIQTISDPHDLVVPNTPQFRALDWLLHADDAQVCPDQVNDVMQRYIAAVLYYSTEGDTWAECNAAIASVKAPCLSVRFLANDSVCSWYQVTCDDTGNIIEIHLRKRDNGIAIMSTRGDSNRPDTSVSHSHSGE